MNLTHITHYCYNTGTAAPSAGRMEGVNHHSFRILGIYFRDFNLTVVGSRSFDKWTKNRSEGEGRERERESLLFHLSQDTFHIYLASDQRRKPVKLSVDNEFEWFFYGVVNSEPRSYRAFSWADSAPIYCCLTSLWQLRVLSFDLFCNPFRSFLGAFSHFRLHMLSLSADPVTCRTWIRGPSVSAVVHL